MFRRNGKKIFSRKGYLLTDLLLAITCSIGILTVVFSIYDFTRDKTTSSEMAVLLKRSAENIHKYYAYDGDYTNIRTIKAKDFYYKGFLPKTWICKDTGQECRSPSGIKVKLSQSKEGTVPLFTWQLFNLSRKTCVSLSNGNYSNLQYITINSSKLTDLTKIKTFVLEKCSNEKNDLKLTFN